MRSLLLLVVATLVATCALGVAGGLLPPLGIKGNVIIDRNTGRQIKLRGVNAVGALWPCLALNSDGTRGYGIFDNAAVTTQPYMDALKAWTVNVVRFSTNVDCWLGAEGGVEGLNPKYTGRAYQAAIKSLVELYDRNGIYVILESHWSANSPTGYALQQLPMPYARRQIPMWQTAATLFRGVDNVIFDLYNEPFPINNTCCGTAPQQRCLDAWTCWQIGGWPCELNYTAAGMQQMVDAVRAHDSTRLLMAGGTNYANDVSQWLAFRPRDPSNLVIPSWHSYSTNFCNTPACWESIIAPLAARVPLIVGELGELDCKSGYIAPLLAWLEERVPAASYLAWVYDTYSGCDAAPALTTNVTDPNACTEVYGCFYMKHLQNVTAAP